jgi:hypothetical protein
MIKTLEFDQDGDGMIENQVPLLHLSYLSDFVSAGRHRASLTKLTTSGPPQEYMPTVGGSGLLLAMPLQVTPPLPSALTLRSFSPLSPLLR